MVLAFGLHPLKKKRTSSPHTTLLLTISHICVTSLFETRSSVIGVPNDCSCFPCILEPPQQPVSLDPQHRAWHESSVSHHESAGLFRAYLMGGWRYGENHVIWGRYHLVLASVKVSRKTTMNWWRNKKSTTIIHCIFWGSVIHENLPDCLGCYTTMVRARAYLLDESEYHTLG